MSKSVLCGFLTNRRTDRQTHTHKSEYRGQPFRVSGFFPPTLRIGPRFVDHTLSIVLRYLRYFKIFKMNNFKIYVFHSSILFQLVCHCSDVISVATTRT